MNFELLKTIPENSKNIKEIITILENFDLKNILDNNPKSFAYICHKLFKKSYNNDDNELKKRLLAQYGRLRASFIKFSTNLKYREHSSNIPKAITSFFQDDSTLFDSNGKIVGEVLNQVLKNIYQKNKFTIIEIGAGTGTPGKKMIPKISAKYCKKMILTDLFHTPFGNYVKMQHPPRKLQNEKTKLEHWKSEKKDRLRRLRASESNFPVISQGGIGIFEVLQKIKNENIENAILFIQCPPPFEDEISIDLIALMESIKITQIQYVIILRHETCHLDGTVDFFDYAKVLSKLDMWNMALYYRTVYYFFGSMYNADSIYWRTMFVFSRTKTKIFL